MERRSITVTRWREQLRGRTPLLIALLAVVVGLILICVFGALLLRSGDDGIFSGEPTPFPSPFAAITDSPIITTDSISLTLNAPTTLQLAGQSYAVRPEPVEADGTWAPEASEPATALWVYGTLINYVFGLPDAGSNEGILQSLAPGDELTLTMRDGSRHTFAVTNRESIPTNRSDVFAQQTPGITLLLMERGGDERLVVQGSYVADTAADSTGGGLDNTVELGEQAQLGPLRLTVTGAESLYNQPSAPAGFIYFLIDTQLQNTGTTPFDLSRLRFALVDDLGNQYASSPLVAQLGNFPPLGGTLQAGATVQATAGYQIPAGLTSPTLTWIVSREGAESDVQISIPYAGSNAEALQNVTVAMQSAQVSPDGTTLVLAGQLANNGTQAVVINETDISLLSNGTVHLMLSTNPALPWVVPPGQPLAFSVSFQRPVGAEAVFKLLNQPFQLSGLR